MDIRFSFFSLAIITAFAAWLPVAKADVVSQVMTAECTSKATGGNGARNACDTRWEVFTAPEGYVFAKETLKGGETSGNGSEHECRVRWGSYVEVIPGSLITQPTIFKLQAHARSPKGYFTGRGWENCEYTVKLTKYIK